MKSQLNICLKFLMLLFITVFGMDSFSQDINRATANGYLAELQSTKADSARVRLSLQLAKFHILKPGELKADLDSGERYINFAHNLSNSLKSVKWQHQSLIMDVVLAMERGDEAQGRKLFNQAIRDFQNTNDKEAEADLRFRFAIWLTTRGTYTAEVLSNFHKSAALYRALKKPALEINVFKEIASIHFDEGKVDIAESELLTVLARYKDIKYPKLHYTYNLLSSVSRVKGNFNKSLRYALLSVEAMKSSNDTTNAANFYADLARIYMEIGNTEKGIEWYKNALQKWKQNERATFGVFVAAGYVSDDLIQQGKAHDALNFTINLSKRLPPITLIQKACFAQNLAICYNALHKYAQAERYYLQSLKLYEESKNDFEVSEEAQRAIGKFYLQREDFNKAGDHLRKALLFNPNRLSTASLKDIHAMLFRVDSAQGRFLSAINHQKIHKQLSDSLLDSRKTREIEELQIQYETEKRKKDLALLSNTSKLQENKLQQASMTQQYTFLGLGLMAVILILLYSQYKLKNKSNRDLQNQKLEISEKNDSLEHLLGEKEWLLKEVHHRVKNNLQIVISLLNTQSSYLDNDVASKALKESQHRLHSISLIHQKLYQSENLSVINMADYISDLTSYLSESFKLTGNIHFDFQLSPIQLDINQAIPVGLILNEAITNAIKHAFKTTKKGNVGVTFHEEHPELVALLITDNGPGFPADFDLENCQSLGMNLINGLSRQLDGTFEITRRDNITCLKISFNHKLTPEISERDF